MRIASAPLEGRLGGLYRASVGSTISGGSAEILQVVIARRGLGPAVTLPLEGVRVVEYAQYVAGPLCGVLLADLGADVVKVEPPGGDGYRHVLPVAPAVGRYFIPLNRGKRSIVVDLKTADGLETSARLRRSADIVLHNFPPRACERGSGSPGRTFTQLSRRSSSDA